MFSVVPVLDDLVHSTHSTPFFGRGLSLMDDLKSQLGGTNEVKTLEDSKQQLVLGVNCESFKPEEIKVSVKDSYISISGEHEEKSEHSYVKRQFSRQFKLPSNAIQEKINSSLNSSGVLKITIPKDQKAAADDLVNIPIQFHK